MELVDDEGELDVLFTDRDAVEDHVVPIWGLVADTDWRWTVRAGGIEIR